MSRTFQPRYIAYAKAHGMTPAAMLEHDAARFPGGKMAGFLVWNSQRIEEARVAIPSAFEANLLRNHAAYDAWLLARAA